MRKLKTVKNVTRSVASIVEIRVRTAMNVFVQTAGTTSLPAIVVEVIDIATRASNIAKIRVA